MDRQGFGIRLGALVIDVVFIIILGFVVNLIFGRGFTFSYSIGTVQGSIAYNLVSGLVGLAYWSTEIFRAASPGKMILGLTIGSETGSPATQNQLMTRFALKHSPNLLMLVGGIIPFLGFIFGLLAVLAAIAVFVGCFFALGQSRQALHDTIAHTAVYRTAPAVIGAPSIAVPPPPPTMG